MLQKRIVFNESKKVYSGPFDIYMMCQLQQEHFFWFHSTQRYEQNMTFNYFIYICVMYRFVQAWCIGSIAYFRHPNIYLKKL